MMVYELDGIERAVLMGQTTMTGHDRIRKERAENCDRSDPESLQEAIVGLQSTDHPGLVPLHDELQEQLRQLNAQPATKDDEWRYEFRPNEKYSDLGIYTILAPNPDAGKGGVVYSGAEVAIADTDDEKIAAGIVRDHNAHRKLVDALSRLYRTGPGTLSFNDYQEWVQDIAGAALAEVQQASNHTSGCNCSLCRRTPEERAELMNAAVDATNAEIRDGLLPEED